MVAENIKYLMNQGWSEADANRYIKLQESGKTPSEAYKVIKEGRQVEEKTTIKEKVSQPSLREQLFGKSKPHIKEKEPERFEKVPKRYRKVYIKPRREPKEKPSGFKEVLGFLGQVGKQAQAETERRYGTTLYPTIQPAAPKKTVKKGGRYIKQKKYVKKIISAKKKQVIKIPPFAVRRVRFF